MRFETQTVEEFRQTILGFLEKGWTFTDNWVDGADHAGRYPRALGQRNSLAYSARIFVSGKNGGRWWFIVSPVVEVAVAVPELEAMGVRFRDSPQ